jgi:hypothetical protein
VERAREEYQGYSFHQADLRDKIRSSETEDSTVQRLYSPPNYSLPMDTDSGCKLEDLRDLITGIPTPNNLELFIQPKLRKDSNEVALKSRLSKSNKARLLIKSKQNASRKEYTPAPHHRPGYVPVLPKLVAREPDKPASETGAGKALAEHAL